MNTDESFEEFLLDGVLCKISIDSEDSKTMDIEIVPLPPIAEGSYERWLQMREITGLDKRNQWTVLGPASDRYFRHLFYTLEENWQLESLPSENELDEYIHAMETIAKVPVEEIVEGLIKENFPTDAIEPFKKLAVKYFKMFNCLIASDFWKCKKAGDI